MARCGSECLNRRIADRGNDGGALDLFDREVEQPQRLAWLTLGMGTVERVVRLQHLVPGLGLVSSSTWKETEPVKTVWDELTGDEEHPTNGDSYYDSPPMYDEYGDEEWYSWVTGVDRNLQVDELGLKSRNAEGVAVIKNGGVAVACAGKPMANNGHCRWTESMVLNGNYLVRAMKEDVKVFGIIFDEFLMCIENSDKGNAVVDGGLVVATSGVRAVDSGGTRSASMDVPSFKPHETVFPLERDLTKDPIIVGIQNGIDLLVVERISVVCDKVAFVNNCISIYDLKAIGDEDGAITRGTHGFNISTLLPPMHGELKLNSGPHQITNNHTIGSCFTVYATNKVGPSGVPISKAQQTSMDTKIRFGSVPLDFNKPTVRYKSMTQENRRWSNAPFDPGGKVALI